MRGGDTTNKVTEQSSLVINHVYGTYSLIICLSFHDYEMPSK
jgi:hypothetical protein